MVQTLNQYEVVGRKLPTKTDAHPKVLRMKIFATNPVRARSKFWYFVRKLRRVKKVNGEILSVRRLYEKNPSHVKNFGIWLRYDSRTNSHNMYKEFRDTTLDGAIAQLYCDMAARHRARKSCIQIIKAVPIDAKDCKRPAVQQFHNSKISFPHPHTLPRNPSKKYRTIYKASRPNTFV
uniref:60S ribosomal protein L18a n=1 Tax=Hirondellea gigas TaxID=1518452 RepID=A0A6A7FQP9_9CRUS